MRACAVAAKEKLQRICVQMLQMQLPYVLCCFAQWSCIIVKAKRLANVRPSLQLVTNASWPIQIAHHVLDCFRTLKMFWSTCTAGSLASISYNCMLFLGRVLGMSCSVRSTISKRSRATCRRVCLWVNKHLLAWHSCISGVKAHWLICMHINGSLIEYITFIASVYIIAHANAKYKRASLRQPYCLRVPIITSCHLRGVLVHAFRCPSYRIKKDTLVMLTTSNMIKGRSTYRCQQLGARLGASN